MQIGELFRRRSVTTLPCQLNEIQDGNVGAPEAPEGNRSQRRCSIGDGSVEAPVQPTRGRRYSSASVDDFATISKTHCGKSMYLDNILGSEFDAIEEGDDAPQVWTTDGISTLQEQIAQDKHKTFWLRVVEHRLFTGFYMVLTAYALFLPDLDMLLGSRTSKLVFSIITSFIVIFFVLEMVLQGVAKTDYLCKAYFWLDLISVISLLPDTYVMDLMLTSTAFVAGRSSRLTRVLRVVARSSRAARLNRLSRIARVAAMMPRIQRFFGRNVKDNDTEKLLHKKLLRIFHFLDDDLDGLVSKGVADRTIEKMSHLFGGGQGASKFRWAAKVISSNRHCSADDGVAGEEAPGGALRSLANLGALRRSLPDHAGEHCVQPVHSDGACEVPTMPSPEAGSRAGSKSHQFLRAVSRNHSKETADNAPIAFSGDDALSRTSASPRATSPRVNSFSPRPFGSRFRQQRVMSKDRDRSKERPTAVDDNKIMLTYEEFKTMTLEDPRVSHRLVASCRDQLKNANNMQNVTSRSSEYVGVKVALCVLLLLFVLTFLVEQTIEDASAEWGLKIIDRLVVQQFSNNTASMPVPQLVDNQVQMWNQGGPRWGAAPRQLLYLDLGSKVYCNEFVEGRPRCRHDGLATRTWGERESLDDIDRDLWNSHYRRIDLALLRFPDFSDQDTSAEELENWTTTVAVLYVRDSVESEARVSLLTTTLVIIVIVVGITFLTKDLTLLSTGLLKPLVELADDMESITRFQLAGIATTTKAEIETTEIKLIRRTFENMKKGIKSWGKYVPWPVVQHLVRRDKTADIEVLEQDVTIFFSDIANFTSIVESIPPEQSLLLLSRYFHEMSRIIDEFGGIVIEFIGDAIMGVYGAPVKNEDHPTAAVKSAVHMLSSLDGMNKWFRDNDLPEVSIRCGVHTGRVLIGNMGFQSRMKYGVVGEESNLPSRLEELNKTYSTKLLISQDTYSRLRFHSFVVRPIDYVHLPEFPGNTAQLVYQVLDVNRHDTKTAAKRSLATLHQAAMDDYRNRYFQRAAAAFEQVNVQMRFLTGQEDVPSTMLMNRCASYIENPPPPEWDGT